MKANSTRIAVLAAALALGGLLWGGTAMAQGIPTPQVSSETCAQVNWAPELLAQHPRIPEACQEVVLVNGENWARIEGRLIAVNPNGSVTAMVIDPQGRNMGRLTLKPTPGQKVILDGREVPFNQLETGAVVHLYIPEHMYAVATEPVAGPSEMATVETAAEPEVATQELPATAGPLPWVLFAGGVMLAIGLVLALSRRFLR